MVRRAQVDGGLPIDGIEGEGLLQLGHGVFVVVLLHENVPDVSLRADVPRIQLHRRAEFCERNVIVLLFLCVETPLRVLGGVGARRGFLRRCCQ